MLTVDLDRTSVGVLDGHLRRLRALPAHGNRTLFYDQLFVALLLSFYNPTTRSLRLIEDCGDFNGRLDLDRMARQTTSDALAAFDPAHLKPVIRDLQERVGGVRRTDASLAGITQRAWEEIEVLYQHGIKPYFDVAALQIFPQTVRRAVKATELFRDALKARRDGRKPIYLTEITWPASKGKTEGIKYQRQETPRGMATKLGQMYRAMVTRRRALGVGRVFWYTWSSPERTSWTPYCSKSGTSRPRTS